MNLSYSLANLPYPQGAPPVYFLEPQPAYNPAMPQAYVPVLPPPYKLGVPSQSPYPAVGTAQQHVAAEAIARPTRLSVSLHTPPLEHSSANARTSFAVNSIAQQTLAPAVRIARNPIRQTKTPASDPIERNPPDEHQEEQRLKQISFGYLTPQGIHLLARLGPNHPSHPAHKAPSSKRNWDNSIAEWRRGLHRNFDDSIAKKDLTHLPPELKQRLEQIVTFSNLSQRKEQGKTETLEEYLEQQEKRKQEILELHPVLKLQKNHQANQRQSTLSHELPKESFNTFYEAVLPLLPILQLPGLIAQVDAVRKKEIDEDRQPTN